MTPTEVPVAEAPAIDSFEQYVAAREAAMDTPAVETIEEEPAAPEPAPVTPSPEPAAPAPVETTPAAIVPEPATESGPVGETQEQKAERERKSKLPQSAQERIDEISRHRGEAERKLAAEQAKNAELAAELARLKAEKPAEVPTPIPPVEAKPVETKPAEPPAPVAAPVPVVEDPEPPAPVVPTLETSGDDFETWQQNLAKYNTEVVKYTKDYGQWMFRQQDKARQAADAARQQTEQQQRTAREAEAVQQREAGNRVLEVGKQKYPSFEQEATRDLGKAVYSDVMVHIMKSLSDSEKADIVHWVANNPDEAHELATSTVFPVKNGNLDAKPEAIEAAKSKVAIRFGRVIASLDKGPQAAPAAEAAPVIPAAPAPAAPVPAAVAPPPPKPPENPKPVVSGAPPPPTQLPESSSAVTDAKSAAANGDFESYEKLRLAKQHTRR